MDTDRNEMTMRRPRTRRRLLPPALALGMLAILLSGCVAITNIALTQRDGIGALKFTATVCAHKNGSSCPRADVSDLQATPDPGQMLVGLAVPADYPVPTTFTFVGETTPVFRPSPTYTSELQRLNPVGAGKKWAGYISDVHQFTPGASGTLSFTLERPAPADGSPRSGRADIALIVGARTVSGVNGDIATRPVFCGATPADLTGSADNTVCGDFTFGMTGSARDLALTGGAPVAVAAGAAAIVPIIARYVGDADPEVNFSLAATTTVPGATAVPNAVTFAPPTDSTNTISVSVAVPASTPPGTYGVTLTGRLASGEVRTGTASIVVAAPRAGGAPPPGTGGVSGVSARCAGRAATIVGTTGPDTLKGTPGADVIAGRGGADVISGLGGDDLICGDAGADRISGGGGRDRMLGGAGPDRLNGGAGRDVLVGGPGADRLTGGGALDSLQGGPGANVLAQ